MRRTSTRQLASCIAAIIALGAGVAQAGTPPVEDGVDLAELSLQELTNLKVTSAAKRPQRAADVAAAVFVITQDDIRRSGATSIPEALRLAPGLQVAQIDSSRWAISARAFSGRLANKLLVLMDGRTLYTPSFAGVYWDANDTLIDDIERIEVIRGPAGTTWGSNAVNGIINIITKRADQTDGLLVSGESGSNDAATLGVRFGQADGPVQWRVYAKALDQPANEQVDGSAAFDDYEQQRVGARFDADVGQDQTVHAALEAYQGHSGLSSTGSFLAPIDPSTSATPADEDIDGVWGIGGWSRQLANDAHLELQAYVDHSNRHGPVFTERRDTMDLDLQYLSPRMGAHTVTAGGGVRHNVSFMEAGAAVVVDSNTKKFTLASAYLQDEIALAQDRAAVTLGARVEDTDVDGATFLPNLRGRYSINEHTTLWGAIARGVRRPGRAETDFSITQAGPMLPAGAPGNPFPVPVGASMSGSDDFHAEELIAYELGWRWANGETLSFDAALFYNDYDELRSNGTMPPACAPGGEIVASSPMCLFYPTTTHVVVATVVNNEAQGHAQGGEAVLTWAPLPQWRLIGAYTHMEKEIAGAGLDPATLLFMFGQDTENEYSLRSSLSVGPRWDFDLFLKHRDGIDTIPVPSATQLDARLAWRPALDLEVAVVGRNLLDDAEVQAVSELYDVARTAIKRSGFVQVRWSFR